VVDGNLHNSFTYHNYAIYTGYQTYSRYRQFDGFSITGDDGSEYRVQGETEQYETRIRKTDITQYLEKAPGGNILESITDGHYEYAITSSQIAGHRLRSEETSGSISTAQTNGQLVTIATAPKFTSHLSFDRVTGDTPETLLATESPFTGSVEMQAEDGSFLFIHANPFNQRSDWDGGIQWIDYDYTKKNGEQILIERDSYDSPRTSAPICTGGARPASPTPWRSAVTKRLYCDYDGKFADI